MSTIYTVHTIVQIEPLMTVFAPNLQLVKESIKLSYSAVDNINIKYVEAADNCGLKYKVYINDVLTVLIRELEIINHVEHL